MTSPTVTRITSLEFCHCFRDSSFELRHQKITPPFRRSLPSECAPRVLPGERTLFHRRSCPSWLQRRPHCPPFPPYRLPSPPPLSLSAENPPCTRCPGKFQYVLFAGQNL